MSRTSIVLEKALSRKECAPPVQAPPPVSSGQARNLYTGLIARCFGTLEPLRIVAFTSAEPREGVTWTVTHLAPEIERTTGLRAAVLADWEVLSGLSSRSTHLLGTPLRPHTADSGTKLASLRDQFDVILVDAGSLAASGSITGLGRMVDAVILVVEAGRTRKQDVRRALGDIAAAQGKVAGCVLNKRKRYLPAWLESRLA